MTQLTERDLPHTQWTRIAGLDGVVLTEVAGSCTKGDIDVDCTVADSGEDLSEPEMSALEFSSGCNAWLINSTATGR